MKWPEKLKALPIFPHLDLVTETLEPQMTSMLPDFFVFSKNISLTLLG